MTPQEFCYWLQGFIEIANPCGMTGEQLQIIKDHLQLVFVKVTPTYPSIYPYTCGPLVPLYNSDVIKLGESNRNEDILCSFGYDLHKEQQAIREELEQFPNDGLIIKFPEAPQSC